MQNNIHIEIAYAEPQQQKIVSLTVAEDSTIRDAILQAQLFSGPIDTLTVGIFGKLRSMSTILQEGDRVEIYRSLINEPKEARKQRVKLERRKKAERKAAIVK